VFLTYKDLSQRQVFFLWQQGGGLNFRYVDAGGSLASGFVTGGAAFLRRKFARSASANRSSLLVLCGVFIIKLMANSLSLRKRLDIWAVPTHRPAFLGVRCCSSVVERVIGNDEVGSSILPSSTIPLL
jgi:hypothetical protein